MSLIAELKRRNVIRMAGLYLVAAWLLVQVAATLLPAFEAPAWVFRTMVTVLGLGFVPVLIFSWVYELTPEGIKRDEEVPPERSIGHVTARRMDRMIIAVLLLALGYFALDKFVLAPRRVATEVATATAPKAAESAATERSIAVLPFQNMSDDKGNQYFADGIAEELLNQLAHVPALQVAGRTSSFAFRDQNQDLREIARKLGVAWIMEGSVRRSGERVRITAQLIKAETGFHAWSETYDRSLTDIFAVQDEIANAITGALKTSLGVQAAKTQIPVPAYDAFLRGKVLMATRRIPDLEAARKEFQATLEQAPDYVPAMVSLARASLLIPLWSQFSGKLRAVDEMVPEAERLVARALELEPDNGSAHAVLGTLRGTYQWRFEEAGREFARALELEPGNAEVVNFAGDFYRMVLDREAAYANERRALELDPLARYNIDDMELLNWAFRDWPEVIARAEASRAASPEALDAYLPLVWAYVQLKRLPEAHRAIAEARERTRAPDFHYLFLEAWVAIAEGRRDDALQRLAKLEPLCERAEFNCADLGYGYLLLGESRRALEWLSRAFERRDFALVFREPIDLELIAADPVTRPLVERPGLRELREIRKRNGG